MPACAVCAVVLVAGCGSGSAPPLHRAGGTIELQTTGSSKAEAIRYAREVNLRPSDVPGMVAAGREAAKRPHGRAGSGRKCGAPTELQLYSVASRTFKRNTGFAFEQVRSGVEVYASPARAQQDFTRSLSGLGNPRVHECWARRIEELYAAGLRRAEARLAARGVDFSSGKVRFGVVENADKSAVLTFTIPFVFRGPVLTLRKTLVVEIVAAPIGRAAITLTTVSFDHPVVGDQLLASLLYARAKEHQA
jgi:hypothetical protein